MGPNKSHANRSSSKNKKKKETNFKIYFKFLFCKIQYPQENVGQLVHDQKSEVLAR